MVSVHTHAPAAPPGCMKKGGFSITSWPTLMMQSDAGQPTVGAEDGGKWVWHPSATARRRLPQVLFEMVTSRTKTALRSNVSLRVSTISVYGPKVSRSAFRAWSEASFCDSRFVLKSVS